MGHEMKHQVPIWLEIQFKTLSRKKYSLNTYLMINLTTYFIGKNRGDNEPDRLASYSDLTRSKLGLSEFDSGLDLARNQNKSSLIFYKKI